jgi:mono/diheme cytochrome c family protein
VTTEYFKRGKIFHSTKVMRKILKWVGIGVAGLLALVVVLVLSLFFRGRGKAAGGPEVAVKTPVAASDTGAVARGRHLASAITPCEVCHGVGLAGKPFGTPGILVAMAAPNLTRGRGGAGATYTATDWDRAVRHGVARDGRRLVIMPSEAYQHLTDADLAALLAYLQTLPPVDSTLPARKVGVLGGALIGMGGMPLAADIIKHDSVGARTIVPAVSAEYGDYLVNISGCNICHGPALQGMKAQGGPPPGPSLRPYASRPVEDLRNALRTGRASGRLLNPEFMPWPWFARMTDPEMEAIWLYLKSLPADTTKR